jgi:putative transcriptional regulator
MTHKRRPSLFERLKKGLEEGIAHARGEITLKTIVHPDVPPEIDGKTIAALRNEAAMSQAVFAKMLSTSTKTVQSWEQGTRVPSMPARRLIQVLVTEPDTLFRVVGLPSMKVTGFAVKPMAKGKSRIVREKV